MSRSGLQIDIKDLEREEPQAYVKMKRRSPTPYFQNPTATFTYPAVIS
jgi:hypothetical protein